MKVSSWGAVGLLSLLSIVLGGCAATVSVDQPSGFFAGVSQKYTKHPGVLLSQLYQFSPFLTQQKEIHLTGTIDGAILGNALSGDIQDVELHVFDTVHVTGGEKQHHVIDFKTTFNLSGSTIDIDATVMMLTDTRTKDHYLFFDEFSSTQSGKRNTLIDIWISLLHSQKKKRIKISDSLLLDYLQAGWLLQRIDENMVNNRVMQGLDTSDIYASEGVNLKTDLHILDGKEDITFDFIPEKILLVGEKEGKEYTISGDIGAQEYAATIQGTADITATPNKAVIQLHQEISFPAGMDLTLHTRSSTKRVEMLDSSLEIPTRYIDIKKILPL